MQSTEHSEIDKEEPIVGELEFTEDKNALLLESCLMKIEAELARLYWNKNQRQIDSPFQNTGESYANGSFEVRAYEWGVPELDEEEPADTANFRYKDLRVSWYKSLGRGMRVEVPKENWSVEFLATMVEECVDAMRKDFGEK